MSEVKTVTPEELEEVKGLQNSYLSATYDLGQLHIQKNDALLALKEADTQIEDTFNHLKVLKQQEAEISAKLQEKYGSSTIDLSTGIIGS
jgi:hypothetical protein